MASGKGRTPKPLSGGRMDHVRRLSLDSHLIGGNDDVLVLPILGPESHRLSLPVQLLTVTFSPPSSATTAFSSVLGRAWLRVFNRPPGLTTT